MLTSCLTASRYKSPIFGKRLYESQSCDEALWFESGGERTQNGLSAKVRQKAGRMNDQTLGKRLGLRPNAQSVSAERRQIVDPKCFSLA